MDTKSNKVKGFSGDLDFCSNFYPCTVVVDGFPFNSSEAAYQAHKSEDCGDWVQFIGVTASESKRLGRRLKLRPDWDKVKLEVMENTVRLKFSQNRELESKLFETRDKYPELVESNWWGDVFFGECNGVGENHLGKILMKIRAELVEQVKQDEEEHWDVSSDLPRK
jgi:ribA/ribD-fused uncharacterized protein